VPRKAELREVVYRLTPPLAAKATQLSLLLSQAAPGAAIETTVTHLDDEGDVWRTLTVHGKPEEVAAVQAAFEAYQPSFLVEKEVMGATARRLILWYKYRPELVGGLSHTRLAFRLLGRDCVITDRAQGGALTIRLLARGGAPLQEFLREIKRSSGELRFELLYSGPPREAAYSRLTPQEEETLRTARELGYFEVPGRVGIRTVAKATAVSPSAASYRLRRAEAKLIDAYLDG
jgi:HTH DNA binding domain